MRQSQRGDVLRAGILQIGGNSRGIARRKFLIHPPAKVMSLGRQRFLRAACQDLIGGGHRLIKLPPPQRIVARPQRLDIVLGRSATENQRRIQNAECRTERQTPRAFSSTLRLLHSALSVLNSAFCILR